MQCPKLPEIGIAELLSACAVGWNVKCIIELWSQGDRIEESVGLAIAARNTGGRHVCIVPDEPTKELYLKSFEEILGVSQPEIVAEVVEMALPRFKGLDFLVVDCTQLGDMSTIIKAAKISPQGATIACKSDQHFEHDQEECKCINYPNNGHILVHNACTLFFPIYLLFRISEQASLS